MAGGRSPGLGISVTVTSGNGRPGSSESLTPPEIRVRSAAPGKARRNRRSSEAHCNSVERSHPGDNHNAPFCERRYSSSRWPLEYFNSQSLPVWSISINWRFCTPLKASSTRTMARCGRNGFFSFNSGEYAFNSPDEDERRGLPFPFRCRESATHAAEHVAGGDQREDYDSEHLLSIVEDSPEFLGHKIRKNKYQTRQ